MDKILSWKCKKVTEKSLHLSTAYRESSMRNSDNSIIYRPTAVFWLWQTFSFQIGLLGKSKLKSVDSLFSVWIEIRLSFSLFLLKNDVDSALIKYSLLVIYG